MAKPRINVHITQSVYRQLETVAKRPGVSKAAIVDAALAAFLSPEADDKRDGAIIRRLDRLDRWLDNLEQDMTVLGETLALHIRYDLTVTPPLPEQDRQAAQALGRERYDHFIGQVIKRLQSGKSLTRKVLEEFTPEAKDFFTAADFTDESETSSEEVSS